MFQSFTWPSLFQFQHRTLKSVNFPATSQTLLIYPFFSWVFNRDNVSHRSKLRLKFAYLSKWRQYEQTFTRVLHDGYYCSLVK